MPFDPAAGQGPALASEVSVNNRVLHRSLLVVAASLSVVTVGCGVTSGGASAGSPQQVAAVLGPKAPSAADLSKAAATTSAVTSERFELTVSTKPSDGEDAIEITSSGEIDGENGRAHLSADLSGRLGGESADTTLEAIYDGDTVYLKAPLLSSFTDKPWFAITSDKLGDAVAKLDGSLQSDPGSFLAFLEGAGGPVDDLGTEDVRGVPTRHVGVQLDVKELLDEAAGPKRKKIEQQLSQYGISLDDLAPLPAEAWIDGDGFVRRFSVSFDLAELAKVDDQLQATGVVTQTIELYDFNEPVEVTVPPAGEVSTFDLSKLLGD